MRIIAHHLQPEDPRTRQVAGCQSLVVPVTVNVKRQMEENEKTHCLAQGLEQKFFGASYQSPLALPKTGDWVEFLPTRKSSETESKEDCLRHHNCSPQLHNKRCHCTHSTSSKVKQVGTGSVGTKTSDFWRMQGVSQRKWKLWVHKKLRASSKESRKSEKSEVLRLKTDWLSRAITYNTNWLVKDPSNHEN